MKTHLKPNFWGTLTTLLFTASLAAQEANLADSTGLPGDNFSLEGAIELFKKAESPEDFEKLLNSEGSSVNNLDLNEDGEIDYIRVVDNVEGDVHAIVLQVPVSEKESQDIAVIEIERQDSNQAILQIIGDEDIFGKQVIAEPFEDEVEVKKKGRGGPSADIVFARVVVNVWLWPSVRFVYAPRYVAWVSPWRWRVYPVWWRPWRPHPWRAFHVRVAPYHRHCHVVTTHRVVHAHKVYAPRRAHSTVVHSRTTTVVKGRHGNVVGKQTKTQTTVRGKKGNVTTQKKTTTRVRRGRRG